MVKSKSTKKLDEREEVLYYLKNGFTKTDEYLKKILKVVNKDTDDIFILRGASGETYLMLHAIYAILNKLGSKHPFIIATAQYHVDLCRLYCPDIPCVFLPLWKIGFEKQKIINKFGKRFFILYPFEHYIKWEKDLADNKAKHYYENLLIQFDLKPADIPFARPRINCIDEFSALKKAECINLNLDNFIFICPEARSNPSLSNEFWKKLDTELKALGYDTLFNFHDTKNVNNLKSTNLSIFECNVLAKYAKGIIGIKSGMIEPFLSLPDIPCISIFTSMHSRFYDVLKPMPVKKHIMGCSTMPLPGNTSNRFEYNGEDLSEEELLKKILSKFKRHGKKMIVYNNYYIDKLTEYSKSIKKICKKGYYNFIVHKHLGDIFYQIQALQYFAKKDEKKINIIINRKYKFLLDLLNVSNYTLVDDTLLDDARFIYAFNKIYPQEILDKDILENVFNKGFFSRYPLLNEPFVLECNINDFIGFSQYWAFRWLKYLNLLIDYKYYVPNKILPINQSLKNKLKSVGPMDKIVLFAPDATTFPEFPPEFWNVIADHVHKSGYKIIVNSQKHKINHGISAFDLKLSLQDVVALGQNCAYVFALRSGLCDVLVGCGARLYAFYPSQSRREMYSLTRPFDQPTGVNEIQIWNWKISPCIWQGIDMTPQLQQVVNSLHRNFYRESIWRILSRGARRANHSFWRNLMRDLCGISRIFPENNIQNPAPNPDTTFMGIPIYSRRTNVFPWATVTKKKYLGGIITFKHDSANAAKIRFIGITIYSRRNHGKYRIASILGVPLYWKNIYRYIFDSIFNNVGTEYDDVYIIRHNIGETFVYLMHLNDWVRRNGSRRPVLIVWNKKYLELYQMFADKNITLKCVNMSQSTIQSVFSAPCVKYKNHRIFCPTPQILKNMIYCGKDVNFYDYICRDFDMSASDAPRMPRVPADLSRRVTTKIQNNFTKPFVILIPNATSLKVLPDAFWNEIASQLISRGYDVFVNSYNSNVNGAVNVSVPKIIRFDTDIAELFVMAKKSSGIISMASGMGVLMTAAGVKLDLIYTDFITSADINVNSSQGIELYSVFNLPNVNNSRVREHDANAISRDELVMKILTRYLRK